MDEDEESGEDDEKKEQKKRKKTKKKKQNEGNKLNDLLKIYGLWFCYFFIIVIYPFSESYQRQLSIIILWWRKGSKENHIGRRVNNFRISRVA